VRFIIYYYVLLLVVVIVMVVVVADTFTSEFSVVIYISFRTVRNLTAVFHNQF